MTVRVQLFAILKERAGRDHVEVELPDSPTVADAISAVARLPGLNGLSRGSARMAVNREYAAPDTLLRDGDELALIPPVSGGEAVAHLVHATASVHASVTHEPLNLDPLIHFVESEHAGAVVSFQGMPRDIAVLEYEAYAAMALEKIEAILEDCVGRFGLCAAAAEHRIGPVQAHESSIAIAVSAPHREAAFDGARAALDQIKAEAPIWKVEVDADGARRRVDGGTARVSSARLTHLDEQGTARMVDVGAKATTERRALARARVRMSPETAAAVAAGTTPKAEALTVARIAGIQAAKRTGELIPLCHPLPLTFADVEARVDAEAGLVEFIAETRISAQTGIEMEAMTAASVAALTLYDMVKGLERGVAIEQVVLLEKSGGASGTWRRPEG